MERVKHGFFHANGLRMHYLDYGGEGRPIVHLHGVTGHAWSWHQTAPVLTALGRVLALDFRGFGESQWSAEGAYSTEDHVADLDAFVAHLGAGEIDLVGLSWGGLVALAFAARHADRVRRLAIVDMPPSFSQSEDEVPPRPDGFDNHQAVVEFEGNANPLADEEVIDLMASVGTRPGPDGRLLWKNDPLFLSRWPFRADDRWGELRELTVPTLLVHAENSYVLDGDVAKQMADTLPGSVLVEIPNSGHVVPVENPAGLSEALSGFLAT